MARKSKRESDDRRFDDREYRRDPYYRDDYRRQSRGNYRSEENRGYQQEEYRRDYGRQYDRRYEQGYRQDGYGTEKNGQTTVKTPKGDITINLGTDYNEHYGTVAVTKQCSKEKEEKTDHVYH